MKRTIRSSGETEVGEEVGVQFECQQRWCVSRTLRDSGPVVMWKARAGNGPLVHFNSTSINLFQQIGRSLLAQLLALVGGILSCCFYTGPKDAAAARSQTIQPSS